MKYLARLAFLATFLAGIGQGQVLLSPRAVAIGAYDAAVRDVRGFGANPAGLTMMRDWDFHAVTYIPTSREGGFVFNGFGMGKRLFEDNALAFQYTPGAIQEFLIPSTIRINGQTISADRKVSYAEVLGFGAAHAFSDLFALGVGVRMRTETVSDPQFELQVQDSTIVPIPNESRATTWFVDLGIQWKALPGLTLSAVGRGIGAFGNGTLPPEFSSYDLGEPHAFVLGAAWDPSVRVHLYAVGGTDRHGALGLEWTPGMSFALRGGLYADASASNRLEAFSVGAGYSYRFFDLDVAYLRFFDRSTRSGTVDPGSFDASEITSVSMNPFTPDMVMISLKAYFGGMREALVHIEGVEIKGSVYPSAYDAFAFKPIGLARVKNISSKPVHVKASLFVDRYMDGPTETPPVHLLPGETAELPLTAVFNDRIRSVQKIMVSDGDVRVSAVTADDFDDRAQARIVIHGRNDWDGDVMSLRYFVTPDDPAVIRYSRDILLSLPDSLAAVPRDLEAFQKARLLFNAFAGKLMYVNDPKLTADYVQYPSETLSLRGGDCDDMTVCFVSLLSSIGISTAFVDVIPPGQPDRSHIYMLFDTGLDPKFGEAISNNPKRYVMRASKSGRQTIWVPIETTLITKGFSEAWSAGAEEYFQHAEVDLGLIKGWVKIVDVN
jgi:hypothetical protein